MQHVNDNIYNLIGKLVSTNSLSQEQQLELDTWRSESQENQTAYDELVKTWQIVNNTQQEINPDIDTEWTRFKELKGSKKSNSKKIHLRRAVGIAAGLAILVTLGLLFNGLNKEVNLVAEDTQIIHKLPDGSIVTLYNSSALQFNTKFGRKSRDLHLTGEAFFEVKKDPIPFIIHTSPGATTKVLGTKFNLNATASGVELNVLEGKVEFIHPDQVNKLIVDDNKSAVYTIIGNDFNYKTYQPNKLSWKTKNFQFNATPISETVNLIEKAYNIRISLPEDTENLVFTSQINNYEIASIAELISKTFGWKYKLDSDKLIFIKSN